MISYITTKMEITKGSLLEKYGRFDDHWHPRIIAELNGQSVKIAKIRGEFVWHSHENEDEFFYVVKGEMKIELRDGVIALREGDYAVIPRGVEHRPVSKGETYILMFEPSQTINTGSQEGDFTKTDLQHL